jgi:RNA polymerase sigma-70 factor (ECF subfamily)
MAAYRANTDQELTALLKQGDKRAYTEIFERYSEVLLRHAFRLLADKDEAYDVVQEDIVFKTSLSAYLYTSVKNRIFNLLAHKKLVVRYAASISRYMVEGYNITDDQVMERELSVAIEREVNALPDKMREVFLLNKRDGLSYKEIGDKLNISDQTAKQQVYKAVKLLKPKIDSFLSIFPFL